MNEIEKLKKEVEELKSKIKSARRELDLLFFASLVALSGVILLAIFLLDNMKNI